MDIQPRLTEIIAEINEALNKVSPNDLRSLCSEILATQRIFLLGAGRSGCVAKMFVVRLAQLGLRGHLVGESSTPPIGAGDLLIVCSGSGRTSGVVAIAEKALSFDARLALISYHHDTFIGKHAAVTVVIPMPPHLTSPDLYETPRNSQILGALFEQCLLLITDLLVEEIAAQIGVDNAKMRRRHANLE